MIYNLVPETSYFMQSMQYSGVLSNTSDLFKRSTDIHRRSATYPAERYTPLTGALTCGICWNSVLAWQIVTEFPVGTHLSLLAGDSSAKLAKLCKSCPCFKGIFPKYWSYSVETIDKVGKWQDPTYFVSKLPYMQMSGPQI